MNAHEYGRIDISTFDAMFQSTGEPEDFKEASLLVQLAETKGTPASNGFVFANAEIKPFTPRPA
jgi:hypothetical protein